MFVDDHHPVWYLRDLWTGVSTCPWYTPPLHEIMLRTHTHSCTSIIPLSHWCGTTMSMYFFAHMYVSVCVQFAGETSHDIPPQFRLGALLNGVGGVVRSLAVLLGTPMFLFIYIGESSPNGPSLPYRIQVIYVRIPVLSYPVCRRNSRHLSGTQATSLQVQQPQSYWGAQQCLQGYVFLYGFHDEGAEEGFV